MACLINSPTEIPRSLAISTNDFLLFEGMCICILSIGVIINTHCRKCNKYLLFYEPYIPIDLSMGITAHLFNIMKRCKFNAVFVLD